VNRRSFLKFLGIGAATAAVVAPEAIAELSTCRANVLEPGDYSVGGLVKNGTVVSVQITNAGSGYIVPYELQIADEHWKMLEYISKKVKQLGLQDIQALQKVKRNGNAR